MAVAVDSAGNVFVADVGSDRVRRVSTSGIITTIAGTGRRGHASGDGRAVSAELSGPAAVAVDGRGNVFIADSGNNRIRRVTPAGRITTVAGTGVRGFGGDRGPTRSAKLAGPNGLALDQAGNLFIVDDENLRVRRVTPGGMITTVAGNGGSRQRGDGGPAVAASLENIGGIAVDRNGDLFISDQDNGTAREVNRSGVISTVVSGIGPNFSDPGSSDSTLTQNGPAGLAVDLDGSLLIADYVNHRVLRRGPDRTVTTFAGPRSNAGGPWTDGVPANSERLMEPAGLAVDSRGNVIISDPVNFRVLRVTGKGTSPVGRDGSLAVALTDTSTSSTVVSAHFLLSDPARITLRVGTKTGNLRTLTTMQGHRGLNEIRWVRNRTGLQRPGTYTLRVTAFSGTQRATALTKIVL